MRVARLHLVRVGVTVRVRVRRAGPMHRGHLDDESEEVIHEGVERLVRIRVRVRVGVGVRVRVGARFIHEGVDRLVRIRVRVKGRFRVGVRVRVGARVIHEGVDRLVHEGLPGHVRGALELVVDEELRRHHNESKGVHAAHHRAEEPRVPGKGEG